MVQIINRKANFNYQISEEIEAGLVLLSSEVKSIRLGQASINESYVAETSGELFLINSHINDYKFASTFNHQAKRPRKLLLHKKQINKIIGKIQQGFSVVPMKIYFNKKNLAKLIIGLGKGKKLFDKRETIKKRDQLRELQRQSD